MQRAGRFLRIQHDRRAVGRPLIGHPVLENIHVGLFFERPAFGVALPDVELARLDERAERDAGERVGRVADPGDDERLQFGQGGDDHVVPAEAVARRFQFEFQLLAAHAFKRKNER